MLPGRLYVLDAYGSSGMLLYQDVIERSRAVEPSALKYMLPILPMWTLFFESEPLYSVPKYSKVNPSGMSMLALHPDLYVFQYQLDTQ